MSLNAPENTLIFEAYMNSKPVKKSKDEILIDRVLKEQEAAIVKQFGQQAGAKACANLNFGWGDNGEGSLASKFSVGQKQYTVQTNYDPNGLVNQEMETDILEYGGPGSYL